ncbi:MAG: rhodanese-related sulfurtransferase [Bacteroidota bacterium]
MKKLFNTVDRRVLKEQIQQSDEQRITLSFYKYAKIGNTKVFRDHFYGRLAKVGVLGRIYVAHEGVNGQISVPEAQYDAFQQEMNDITFLQNIRHNIAIEDDGKSFFKLKIKIKDKIVADGLNDATFDVTDRGIHVNAVEFNEITNDPNTIIVDMRNHYESEVGHFKEAITPDVDTFREALKIVEDQLENDKDKNIVMYCTGGIRCEKASAYYKHKGFKNVFQLDGGIIEYARQVKEQGLENKYIGKNFVFDDRMGERITDDVISSCHQCGTISDRHVNCANDACHRLFIQCEDCAEEHNDCCSDTCTMFVALPEDTQKELRKGIYKKGKHYTKGRTSPFLEDQELQAQVKELYLQLKGE